MATIEERVELNRKLAYVYRDGFRDQQEAGRTNLDAWVFAPDAVFFMPYFTGNEVVPMGGFLQEAGITLSDLATYEAYAYSKVLPDWHNVEFHAFPSDVGFAFRARMEGHDKTGKLYSYNACDFFYTNEEGQIARWETHMDDSEFGPVLELLMGQRGPFKSFDVYWKAIADHLTDEEGGSVLRNLIGG